MLSFVGNILASIQSLNLFSLEGLVFLFGKLCIVATVYFANEAGMAFFDAEQDDFEAVQNEADAAGDPNKKKTTLSDYRIISKRNIFGTQVQATRNAPAPPVTKLKLRLVGTNLTPEQPPFAIIENTKNKEQDLFDLNDTIFSQAKLVEIFQESVRIEINGKVETLVLEEGTKGGGGGGGVESSEDGNEFVVSEEEVTEALANLPRLLSQARAVPYFKNGKSVGMRLFAIRRGSLYEKLGLKNGDILKSVNNNNLSDPSQALKIFEQLKTERSIQVTLERAQQQKTLSYEIK